MSAEQAAHVAKGDLTQTGLSVLRSCLDKKILPVFDTQRTADTHSKGLSNFVQWLSQLGLSAITIQQHFVALRKVLTHAYTHGAIPALPKSPTVRVFSTQDGGFRVAEYRKPVAAVRKYYGTRIPITTTERSERRTGTVDGDKAQRQIRSLHCLRHTAISLRLLYGGHIDLLTSARNARTSVEMVECFYASQLSAEMNIALLHGPRRG